MKLLSILFFLTSTLFAFSIPSLQEEFKRNVIEKNIYKEYFQTFLMQACVVTDEACIDKTIQRLKSWESTQADQRLKSIVSKRLQDVQLSPIQQENTVERVISFVEKKAIATSQYLTLIDLSQQQLILTFYDAITQQVAIIGSDLISTGNMQKEAEVILGDDHYLKTPVGVFENVKGWRSDGKYNEAKKVLAYGQKGRFVFYFGKHQSIRYNTFDKEKKKITNPKEWKLITDYLEFAMHSHESSKKMGKPNSHGCIRITHELNLFLDEELALHGNNIQNNQWTNNAQKPYGFEEKTYQGKYLLVFDKI